MDMKFVFLGYVLLMMVIMFSQTSLALSSPKGAALRGERLIKGVPSSPRPGVIRGPRPIVFGATITRDEWLVKEYFGYLCASNECVPDDLKADLTEKCFDPHEKLKALVTSCFGQMRRCSPTLEDRSMSCVIRESKGDPQLIPLTLHDCVDERISMKTWKCMRRSLMEKLKNVMELFGSKKGKDATVTTTIVGSVTDIHHPPPSTTITTADVDI